MKLSDYQGRRPDGKGPRGHRPMFTQGVRPTRATKGEDTPRHFVRIGGYSWGHDADPGTAAGVGCMGCMALAANMRQWVESIRRGEEPPAHEL